MKNIFVFFLLICLPLWVVASQKTKLAGNANGGENRSFEKAEEAAFLEYEKEQLPEIARLREKVTLCAGKTIKRKVTKEEKFDVAFVGRRYLRKIEEMSTRRNQVMLKFMGGRKCSKAWLAQLSDVAVSASELRNRRQLKKARKLYKKIPKKYLALGVSKKILRYLYPAKVLTPGDKMADFKACDYNGKLHYLSELRGETIVLVFSSQGYIPNIEDVIYSKYRDEVEIVAVSQEAFSVWKDKQIGVDSWNNWNGIHNKFNIRKRYGVKSFPAFIIINPSGIIKTICYDANSLEGLLEKYFLMPDID